MRSSPSETASRGEREGRVREGESGTPCRAPSSLPRVSVLPSSRPRERERERKYSPRRTSRPLDDGNLPTTTTATSTSGSAFPRTDDHRATPPGTSCSDRPSFVATVKSAWVDREPGRVGGGRGDI